MMEIFIFLSTHTCIIKYTLITQSHNSLKISHKMCHPLKRWRDLLRSSAFMKNNEMDHPWVTEDENVPAKEILVLIAHAEQPFLNSHSDVSSGLEV